MSWIENCLTIYLQSLHGIRVRSTLASASCEFCNDRFPPALAGGNLCGIEEVVDSIRVIVKLLPKNGLTTFPDVTGTGGLLLDAPA